MFLDGARPDFGDIISLSTSQSCGWLACAGFGLAIRGRDMGDGTKKQDAMLRIGEGPEVCGGPASDAGGSLIPSRPLKRKRNWRGYVMIAAALFTGLVGTLLFVFGHDRFPILALIVLLAMSALHGAAGVKILMSPAESKNEYKHAAETYPTMMIRGRSGRARPPRKHPRSKSSLRIGTDSARRSRRWLAPK